MAKYSVICQRTAAATKTVGSVAASNATALRRVKIIDVQLGSEDTPADNAFLWQFQRFSAAGTSTAVTPQPLDAADGTAVSACGANHTVEPTYTANAFVLSTPLNQRMTFRWLAAPGEELVVPATNANGIGAVTTVASAVKVTCNLIIDEQ